MRLRRKKNDDVTEVTEVDETIDAGESADGAPDDAVELEPVEGYEEPADGEVVLGPSDGPYDFEDLDPAATYIDLGSMLIQPIDPIELRVQVDEQSGEVLAVLLAAEEGVAELRAFASSRGGDLWETARKEIAADTAQRGGTATEQDGPFGTELYCEVPVTGPEGESLVQPSRIVGVTGPRWFVRATLAGRPALDPEYAAAFEETVRTMAVRRGEGAMAPGEPLPLKLPPEARRLPDAD